MPGAATLRDLRDAYHTAITLGILGARPGSQVLSNADAASQLSVDIAQGIADRIGKPLCSSLPSGQGMGAKFATFTKEFLDASFARLKHIRPGSWRFSTSQGAGIAAFDQYEHLARLAALGAKYEDIRAILGGDYIIAPDVVVSRQPETDATINAAGQFVTATDGLAALSPLRADATTPPPLATLHASVSCKWTMRSDRAQNTRTEALNLIRNRKGKTPQIIVVTAEPLPRRIASIALGTGDVDCTYHAALPELLDTLESKTGSTAFAEALAELRDLISGRRLRDISDLPFDLAL